MTTLRLTTRDQADGRIFVADGQGTSGSYPRDYHDPEMAHRNAARQFLAQLKGWRDPHLEVLESSPGGCLLTATRTDGTPSRRRKPVPEALRVARYLEWRRELPVDDVVDVIRSSTDEPRPLTASDLQALLDYIREA